MTAKLITCLAAFALGAACMLLLRGGDLVVGGSASDRNAADLRRSDSEESRPVPAEQAVRQEVPAQQEGVGLERRESVAWEVHLRNGRGFPHPGGDYVNIVDEKGRVVFRESCDGDGIARFDVDLEEFASVPGKLYVMPVCKEGVPLNVPANLLVGGINVVYVAAQLWIEGNIYDPLGRPANGAKVSIAWIMRTQSGGIDGMMSKAVAKAGEDGAYSASDVVGFGGDCYFVACWGGGPPRYARLPDASIRAAGSGPIRVDFWMEHGAQFLVHVKGLDGKPVARTRLEVSPHRHPLRSDVINDGMPSSAARRFGLSASVVETDDAGTALVTGWDQGADARVSIVGGGPEEVVIRGVSPGEVLGDGVAVCVTWGGECTIVVEESGARTLRVSGVLRWSATLGLPEAHMLFGFDHGGNIKWPMRMGERLGDWLSFSCEVRLNDRHEDAREVSLRVIGTDGREWDSGTFPLVPPYRIDGLRVF